MTLTTDRPAPGRTAATDRPIEGRRAHRSIGPDSAQVSRRVDADVYRRRRLTVALIAAALVLALIWAIGRVGAGGATAEADAARPEAALAADPVAQPVAAPVTAPAAPEPDLAALENVNCLLDVTEVARGDTGEAVSCVQTALFAATIYDGAISGQFDEATTDAVRNFQDAVGLYVDGIVGKQTATELGIWPGVEAFIVRTPPPPAGAADLWGMPLSTVASAGDDAPPLPDGADAVEGKRVVYDRTGQRVWAVDDQERIVRSYLVSGSQYRNEVPGVHTVYSKSESALGWDLTADLPYMIRYTQTERGHIGFHAIPNWRDTGEKLQTVDELGLKLSGGCTRQALLDAQFLWEFAEVGTKVVVI